MRIYDLFSGIGGFSEAARRVGWSTAGICEFDKTAVAVYNKNFGTNHTPTDVRKLNTSELPDFEVLTAGFPCQAFSLAGKRKGFDDSRGNLFFEVIRILRDKRPKYFLLENVKGLLSHDSGRTFGRILLCLGELGYACEWQVLNSKYFGVPQNRERVFIIGHFGERPRFQVFPLGENVQAADGLQEQNTNALTARYEGAQATGTYIIENQLKEKRGETVIIDAYNSSVVDCPGAVRPNMSNAGPLIAIPVLTPNRKNKRQHGRRFKNDGEPAFTLTSQDVHGVSDGVSIRRLTPEECEALQSFPRGWTEGVSDSQRYRLLGNSITVSVAEAIFREWQNANR